jgi:CO dehydrogenase/acetyl-CoA synthase alpha subunit
VIHDLEQGRAALATAEELGRSIQLRSALGAAAYVGVGYLKALGDALGQELMIDCGDDAGIAMAALRTGCRRLSFSGTEDLAERLSEMAEQLEAVVVHETTASVMLESLPGDDVAALLRQHLPRRC